MDTTTPGTRPTFLTVLCILSFLMGAWGLWNGIEGAFTDQPQRDLEEARTEMETAMAELEGKGVDFALKMMESSMAMLETAVANAVPLGYIGLVASALSLLGVWMMWNLKRTGYWIYIVAGIAGFSLPFIYIGFSNLDWFSLGFGAFITILFIVLYGLNLKHMS